MTEVGILQHWRVRTLCGLISRSLLNKCRCKNVTNVLFFIDQLATVHKKNHRSNLIVPNKIAMNTHIKFNVLRTTCKHGVETHGTHLGVFLSN
jgi:hypothetical protein